MFSFCLGVVVLFLVIWFGSGGGSGVRRLFSCSFIHVLHVSVDGKKMASVFEALFLFPECIFRPNLIIIFCMMRVPWMVSSLDSNRVAQSSTYISMWVRRQRSELSEGLWLVRVPWFGGEYRREMGLMLAFAQCLWAISSRACMTRMKRVGARLSPCFTPVV